VHPKTYESTSLREDILTTLRRLERHADAIGATAALAHLNQITHEGSDATYLRRQYQDRGSSEGMVEAAIGRFREQGG
jgi:carboxylate-amine ligase